MTAAVEPNLRSNRTIAIAAFCSVLLITSVTFSIVFIGGEVRQFVSFKALVSALETGSLEVGQEALETYQADSLLFRLSKRVVYPFQRDASEQRERATQNLSIVVTKIGLNDYQGAALLFRDVVLPSIDDVLAAMPLSNEDTSLLHAIIDRFEGWSKDVFELARLENSAPEQFKENERKIAQQTELASDVAMQFAQFLNLTPKVYESGEAMQFYKSGILRGLPLLNELEDDIKDVHQLKTALDLAGGRPEVQGPNAPELFQKRIDGFRLSSSVFRQIITKLEKENAKSNKRLKTLRKTVYTESQRVRLDLIALIKEVARPRLSLPSSFALKYVGDES